MFVKSAICGPTMVSIRCQYRASEKKVCNTETFVWQVPVYALNQYLVTDVLKALDVGGSITIHAFGAYYGLAASVFLSPAGTDLPLVDDPRSYMQTIFLSYADDTQLQRP